MTRFAERTGRISGKGSDAWLIHERACDRRDRGEDVLFLTIGDTDFDTPAPITRACIDSLHAGDTHYSGLAGIAAYRAAVAERYSRVEGIAVRPEQVVVSAGAQHGLFCAAQCILDPGDEVILPEPKYVTYDALLGAAGATVVPVATDPTRNFHLDIAAIERAVTPRTKCLFINTPNNPTGTVLTREEVEAVADICIRHDLWCISDEVYATLTYERGHVSPLHIPGMAERTIVVGSLSKSHAMTGWRIGWVIGPDDLAEHLINLSLAMMFGIAAFIQKAGVVALTRDLDEAAAMKAELRARRDAVYRLLGNAPGLRVDLPEAGMFVMPDVSATGLTPFAFADRLLAEEGVAVLPADGFGLGGEGRLRLSLSVPVPVLEDACARMIRFAERVQTETRPAAAGMS